MKSVRAVLGSIAIVLAMSVAVLPARAQEISDSHLQAALRAFQLSQSGEGFDEVLPNIADQVMSLLISQRPDLYRQIETAVNDAAVALVVRRADLNNDIARLWARLFTEEELNVIIAFYSTSAGQKLAVSGSDLLNSTVSAVQNWSERLGEEMLAVTQANLESAGVEF
ncbi:MAG: DUF2059 domain-containing protein [Bauldia sp.]|nr:DUF2059 domain-containing protein [Bauldia sp.]